MSANTTGSSDALEVNRASEAKAIVAEGSGGADLDQISDNDAPKSEIDSVQSKIPHPSTTGLHSKTLTSETEAAHLGGWVEHPDAAQNQGKKESQSNSTLPLLDPDDLVTPDVIEQQQPWWMRVTPQIAVGSTAVMGVLYITFSLFGLWGTSASKPSRVLATNDASGIEQQVSERIKQLTAENENLKKSQIMGEGQPQQTPKPQAQKPSPPTSVAPKPKIVYITKAPHPSYNSQPVAYKPSPTVARARVIATAPKAPKLEPMERVMAAANVGNYGENALPSGDDSFSSSGQTPAAANVTHSPTDETTDSDMSQWSVGNSDASQQSVGNSTSSDEVNLASTEPDKGSNTELTPINTGEDNSANTQKDKSFVSSSTSLVVGTRSEGKLETPIAWSGQLQNPMQKFLVRLSKPLKASDGTVAFAKNSYLVAQVETATDSGIVQMSAVAVLSTVNGRTIEQPLPKGAILILGKGGKPLQAKSIGSDRVGSNLGMALLSGAATAASVANGVTSQSIYSQGGTFTSSTKTDDPNYVAGFGQGITTSLASQMQQRSQQMQQRLNSAPSVFAINQGTSVQIFVNSTVSL